MFFTFKTLRRDWSYKTFKTLLENRITRYITFFYILDDHSRVILKTDIENSDYINANYITVSITLTFNAINAR